MWSIISWSSRINKVKTVYHSYVDNLFNFARALSKIENFSKKNFIIAHRSAEEYALGIPVETRFFHIFVIQFVILINTLRFYFSIILKNTDYQIYLMDISEQLGHPVLISSSIGTVSLAILGIGITATYQEKTQTLHLIDLFYSISEGKIKYPLTISNFRKYCRKVNLVTDFVFKEFHIFMVSFCVLVNFVLTLKILIDNEFNIYLLASFIFFNVIMFIFANLCFGYVWVGFVLWFSSTLYLKYKFNEINEKIELSLKHSNINLLMNVIEEHNYVEIMTKKFNHFFRMITFIIYYIATIGFQIMFFAIHNKDSTPFGRVGAATIFGSCFWSVLYMNIMSTWVNNAAHKPYYKLYSIINQPVFCMRFRHHWKILLFIEKLSGRPIGYYCYDLFPMNNWEFYQYLLISGSNYILIMSLFN